MTIVLALMCCIGTWADDFAGNYKMKYTGSLTYNPDQCYIGYNGGFIATVEANACTLTISGSDGQYAISDGQGHYLAYVDFTADESSTPYLWNFSGTKDEVAIEDNEGWGDQLSIYSMRMGNMVSVGFGGCTWKLEAVGGGSPDPEPGPGPEPEPSYHYSVVFTGDVPEGATVTIGENSYTYNDGTDDEFDSETAVTSANVSVRSEQYCSSSVTVVDGVITVTYTAWPTWTLTQVNAPEGATVLVDGVVRTAGTFRAESVTSVVADIEYCDTDVDINGKLHLITVYYSPWPTWTVTLTDAPEGTTISVKGVERANGDTFRAPAGSISLSDVVATVAGYTAVVTITGSNISVQYTQKEVRNLTGRYYLKYKSNNKYLSIKDDDGLTAYTMQASADNATEFVLTLCESGYYSIKIDEDGLFGNGYLASSGSNLQTNAGTLDRWDIVEQEGGYELRDTKNAARPYLYNSGSFFMTSWSGNLWILEEIIREPVPVPRDVQSGLVRISLADGQYLKASPSCSRSDRSFITAGMSSFESVAADDSDFNCLWRIQTVSAQDKTFRIQHVNSGFYIGQPDEDTTLPLCTIDSPDGVGEFQYVDFEGGRYLMCGDRYIVLDVDFMATSTPSETQQWAFTVAKTMDYKMNASGYGTLCTPIILMDPSYELRCGIVWYDEERPTEGELPVDTYCGSVFKANTGLIIIGTPGKTYRLDIKPDNYYFFDMTEGNLMEGTCCRTTGFTPGTYYGLKAYAETHSAVLAKSNTTAVPANKAYLPVSNIPAGVSLTSAFSLCFGGDDTEGIQAQPATMGQSTTAHDLQGREVKAGQGRGLYIVNGKKYIR